MRENRRHAATAVSVSIIATIATVIGFLQREAVHVRIFPLIIRDCRYHADMSWTLERMAQKGLADFCGSSYYHSASWRTGRSDGAIPMIRPSNIEAALPALVSEDYCKSGERRVFVLNEPDIPGQDEIPPAEAVDIYRRVATVLPDCVLIWPNSNWAYYLRESLRLLGDDWRDQDIIGIHIYPGGLNRPYQFPKEWIETRKRIIAQHGIEKYMITEAGPFDTWSDADLRRFFVEMFESDALAVYIFTTHCGGSLVPCYWKLYETETVDSPRSRVGDILKSVVDPTGAAYP